MATLYPTLVAPVVELSKVFTVRESACCTTYVGTREALIAKGLATASMFPRASELLGGCCDRPDLQCEIAAIGDDRFALIRFHEGGKPSGEYAPNRISNSLIAAVADALNEATAEVSRYHKARVLPREDLDRLISACQRVLRVIMTLHPTRASEAA